MTKFKTSLMTRTMLGAVAISMVGSIVLASSAKAEELWDPYLRAVNEGVPAGALPPPGVYGVLDNYWADYSAYNSSGHKVPGTQLTALVEVPIVLWVPGIKFLGADYAAAIAQPFDYTSSNGLSGTTGAGNLGIFNTVLIPGILSWSLPDNFHVSTGLEVYLPDASSTIVNNKNGTLKNGGLGSGNGYTAIQPDLGVSYLADGWNLSIGSHFSIPVTEDTQDHFNYWSGDQFSADYTVTKTIGKWTFGVGAHQENQINKDTQNGIKVAGSENKSFGMGPIVGYQLGTVSVTANWDQNIAAASDVAGTIVNIRLVTAF
jgi:hypothetical protein